MSRYASTVVNQARKWVGLKESDGSFKKIIDIYNSQKPLPVGYKLSYSDPWCAGFVSAVVVEVEFTDIIPCECSCPRMIELFKKKGIWVENENRIPSPGDILFFDWEDDGVGDNKGGSDHVGIVEEVNGNTITVIEGNYSNSVKRRYISVNGKYIRGYGVPKYDKEPDAISKPVTVQDKKIDTVVEVQDWLNKTYSFSLVKDGIYGKLTKSALVKALQMELGFTGKNVDGIYGNVTNRAVKTLRIGSTGSLVKVLQAALICLGYPKAYVDGIYGSGTEGVVRSYQNKKGIVSDGEAGKQTFSSIFR